jgi:hypothetical protein
MVLDINPIGAYIVRSLEYGRRRNRIIFHDHLPSGATLGEQSPSNVFFSSICLDLNHFGLSHCGAVRFVTIRRSMTARQHFLPRSTILAVFLDPIGQGNADVNGRSKDIDASTDIDGNRSIPRSLIRPAWIIPHDPTTCIVYEPPAQGDCEVTM